MRVAPFAPVRKSLTCWNVSAFTFAMLRAAARPALAARWWRWSIHGGVPIKR
jgi:hypothetical protein